MSSNNIAFANREDAGAVADVADARDHPTHEVATAEERTKYQTTPRDKAAMSLEQSRELSRRIAQQITPQERKSLYERSRRLAYKKTMAVLAKEGSEGLDPRIWDWSHQDERDLAFVRWKLNRIEDAETGESLDAFEALAEMAQRTSKRIADFAVTIRNEADAPKPRPRFPRR